jgi:hypothetical protein
MAATPPRQIFYSRLGDGGEYLAASIGVPRFCVAAPTREEAKAKAERAIEYYHQAKGSALRVAPRATRVITPAFELEELSA